MTLDEAIEHCEEKAKEQDKLATRYEDASGYSRSHIESLKTDESIKCRACASEHRQLAEWLRELKAYKKAYTEIDSKIESDYMGNNEYEMAVSDGYQSAINIIDRCIEEVNADKGVLEKINEKQDSLRATCKAWDEAIEKDGYVD